MGLGGAVADINLVVRRLQELLADRRWQPLAQHDRVALAMLEALDAELLVLVGYGGLRRSGDRNIGREIGLSRQRVGEVETDARRGRFVVDLVVEDAEAVLGAHRLVGFSDVDRIATVERGFQGVEGWTPLLVTREQIAKDRQ